VLRRCQQLRLGGQAGGVELALLFQQAVAHVLALGVEPGLGQRELLGFGGVEQGVLQGSGLVAVGVGAAVVAAGRQQPGQGQVVLLAGPQDAAPRRQSQALGVQLLGVGRRPALLGQLSPA
jgi:hypothetical protein